MRPIRVAQAGLLVLAAGLSYGDAGALTAVLGLAVLGAAVLVWRLPYAHPHRLVAEADEDVPQHFPTYDRLYAALVLARSSARQVDLGLRPALQRVLAVELARHGPEAVRARLGERWWALLDPARPSSDDSSAGGLDARAIRQLLDALEAR